MNSYFSDDLFSSLLGSTVAVLMENKEKCVKILR